MYDATNTVPRHLELAENIAKEILNHPFEIQNEVISRIAHIIKAFRYDQIERLKQELKQLENAGLPDIQVVNGSTYPGLKTT